MNTICLNVIMKNESKVILRMLESTLKLINTYCIIDTGSTDDSISIVKDFFDSKGISGEVIDYPKSEQGSLDFCGWRNFAVKQAKGKSDFAFWLDCDEELKLSDDFNREELDNILDGCDLCTTNVSYGSSFYGRRNLFRLSKNFYWQGKVHEILLCKDPIIEQNYTKLTTFVYPDGNSWTPENIKGKYEKHAKVLQKEVDKHNEPRDIFYLAQSYKDAGGKKNIEKSIYYYKRRAAMDNGFYEERYYSQLMIGSLMASNNYPESDIIIEYLKCSDLDNARVEHLVNLIIYLQGRGKYEKALIFSTFALNYFYKKNPHPNRQLFLSPHCYEQILINLQETNLRATGRANNIASMIKKESLDDLFNSMPSGWIGHREFASWLVNYIQPKVTVELGVDYGYSLFSLAAPNIGKVYGIDHFKGDSLTGFRDTEKGLMENIEWLKEKHGINNIEIINGSFNDVAKSWYDDIDIIHFDSTPSELKNDYEKWSRFLPDYTVLLFHNTRSYDDITRFFSELSLPKVEFEQSGGLGIASKNEGLINAIKEKYFPSTATVLNPITIGYIAHNKDVYEKYLKPSIESIADDFEVVFTTDELKPAANYNKIIDASKNKYILFVHEDVTFSPDFLNDINKTIAMYPNFGAIGAVGTINKTEYRWAEKNTSKKVERLDCCCILINKEHGLRFDEENFDEFHLYVEDYCMQVINKGLTCHTILTDAFEAKKYDVYENKSHYFKHHSHTVNQRGYCWGRYHEYLERLENKWHSIGQIGDRGIDGVNEVDICIISYAKNDELKKVTERGIETLLQSEGSNIKFNVFIVESNKEVSYNQFGDNVKTIYPTTEFGYNKYLNLAVKEGKAPYCFLANNDLSYEKGWASKIIKAMNQHPEILSASPFCPQIQNRNQYPNDIYRGRGVRKELAGWAIFVQRKIFDIIGELNEGVDFWFSDNIYEMQLTKHNVTHALITNSIVNHHENNLGTTGETTLDANKKNEYTTGQHQKYLQAKNNLLTNTKN